MVFQRNTQALSILGFLACAVIVGPGVARAEVVPAPTCAHADVADALAAASAGDLVIVPAGQCIWTSPGDYHAALTIPAGVTLHGAGPGRTEITLACADADCRGLSSDGEFRLAGFSFDGAEAMVCIRLSGELHGIRIDHNRFTRCLGRAIELHGYIDGLIDHNEFVDNRGGTDVAVYGDGDAAWARPMVLGSTDGVVFAEENQFLYTASGYDEVQHAISANNGGRYVCRYNLIDALLHAPHYLEAPLDAHGFCFYGRGTVSYEIYENEIRSHRSYRGMFIRGGTGVIFNNRFVGDADPNDVDFQEPIHLFNYRSCTTCDAVEPPTCIEGYPCQGQIRDLYLWGNTLDGDPVGAEVDGQCPEVLDHIQEDRDYFHAQMPGYEPYDYPHPETLAVEPCPGVCCEAIQVCTGGIQIDSSDCATQCCVGASPACSGSGDAGVTPYDGGTTLTDGGAAPTDGGASSGGSGSGCSCRQAGSSRGWLLLIVLLAWTCSRRRSSTVPS